MRWSDTDQAPSVQSTGGRSSKRTCGTQSDLEYVVLSPRGVPRGQAAAVTEGLHRGTTQAWRQECSERRWALPPCGSRNVQDYRVGGQCPACPCQEQLSGPSTPQMGGGCVDLSGPGLGHQATAPPHGVQSQEVSWQGCWGPGKSRGKLGGEGSQKTATHSQVQACSLQHILLLSLKN